MKKYYLLIAGLLILLGAAWLLSSAGRLEAENTGPEKKIELAETTVRGYKDGRLLWSLQSRYIWSALNIDHAVVENIYNGRLYDNGRLLLDDFSARKVQANAPQERLYADKGFRATLRRGGQQPVSIWGEQLNYSAAAKRSTLQKKILVVDRGTRINASKAEIDHAAQQLFFGKDTVLTRPDTTLTADELTVDLKNDIFTARSNVRLTREPEQTANELRRAKTLISADTLQADVSGNFAQMTLSGNVFIEQAGKQASGRQALYNEKENLIYLSDGEYSQAENAAVVKAQKIIVDIAAEKFTAAGAAEASIILPRKQ
ncbi:hypothetical protein NO1_0289 [Candidatus Termititenax aidoneus]|uniref:Organic solvent tolerance-like N-terminal domain-containing protein n=1 Tax=Termititenax aidoneus TaxID=2218524 RepID=A0A388T8G4_TERA1|nr:hypothetical protein NO1_0289 [Candidatus Termititenax aidoneus]